MASPKLNSIKAKYQGTAPCKWCPKCAGTLVDSQIIGKDNLTISGKKCINCGYIVNQTITK